MRNWNCERMYAQTSLHDQFWAYLWGIETWEVARRSGIHPSVLSLPMRNWNTNERRMDLYDEQSFEPTYEELKPVSPLLSPRTTSVVLSLPMRNWNPQNESIRDTAVEFWAYLWGIETITALISVKRVIYVLSLPMRNWNQRRCWLARAVIRFWAYLWGIETDIAGSDPKSNRIVLSLPMRNWNTCTPDNVALVTTVLSLPMRNWNIFRRLPETCGQPVLSLPMRNWNCRTPPEHPRQGSCFEPTYEELKPAIIRYLGWYRIGFWAYLWGIETSPSICCAVFCRAFWAYLWGIETQSGAGR